jgi:hypothetical protein
MLTTEMDELGQIKDLNKPLSETEKQYWKSGANNPRTLTEARKVLRAFEVGDATAEDLAQFAFDVEKKADAARIKNQFKSDRDRVRGYREFNSRLNSFADKGYITDEAADMGIWLASKNPDLMNDLSITAKSDLGEAEGSYNNLDRLVKLAKGSKSNIVAVHETLHHTEKMLPKEIREGIRTAWEKAAQKEIKVAMKAGDMDRSKALGDVMMLPFVKVQSRR